MIEIDIFSMNKTPLCKIRIDSKNTIEDVKKEVAAAIPKLSTNRQSIREEARGKDLKNSLVLSNLCLTDGSRLYVKDLGAQISWTAVFLTEYFGPLLIYSIFAFRPQVIYGDSPGGLSTTANLAWLCWMCHYLKRILETVFVHRFSHETMQMLNLFKNCSYYWGFSALISYHVNHPLFTPPPQMYTRIGVCAFVFCEFGNLSTHLLFRDLRPAGSKVRKIPVPNKNPFTWLFNLVSCPNYTYEFGAWASFAFMTSCVSAALFAVIGLGQMTLWALTKHRLYKKEFVNYPKQRKAIIPFIL